MRKVRSFLPALTMNKWIAGIVVMSMACAVAVAWSAASRNGSATDQFVLQPIPASAVHHSWQAPRVRNKNGTSTNWSGYAVETSLSSPASNAVSDVKGTWVVPTVIASTSANTYSSSWIGIDGYSDGTVEQLGTEQDWSNGKPVYYAWIEMYPKGSSKIVNFTVHPGDTISAEVQYTGKSYNLLLKNVTTNVSFATADRSPSAKRQSAEWVEEAPWSGGVLPLADFGTVNFSGCSATLNGHTGPINNPTWWQKDAITMETSTGTAKATPSALGADGSSFTINWSHE